MVQPYDPPPPDAQLLQKPKSPDATAGKLAALAFTPHQRLFLFAVLLLLQITLLCTIRPFPSSSPSLRRPPSSAAEECPSGKVYVYDLPTFFNKDLISRCDELSPWNSRCDALSNGGFGRSSASELAGVVPDALLPSWFATDQFAAELIYHNRMLSHRCRTSDPAAATAFYIPFYAGLAVGKHLWSSNSTSGERDLACLTLLRWIKSQKPWIRSNGWDHFIMLGRITWDFRRSHDGDWGGSFLYMPEMENVTRLLIERNPWDDKDIGVPYPTGFHPKSATEVKQWRDFVLSRNRTALFSFAGAARTGFKDDFRAILLNECERANGTCRSVDCSGGRCGNSSREAVSLFVDSTFCLQPRGDSFTRRSMFDCMVAGSIPVLFWRRSAYVQYEWFLPGGGERSSGEWSVFVDRRAVREGAVSVREVLEGIGEERVRRMRERVVEMIPRLVYGGAEDGIRGGVMDAVDVAVDGVLRRFRDRGKGASGNGSGGDQR